MSLEEIDFMVMGSALVARQAVKNYSGGINQPLTVASIEDIHYEQLYALEKFEPQRERLAYHDKKYLCYKEFVDFSLRIDKITNQTC